ncbi:Sugar transport protein 8 [Sesamum alatum]|uniref:Sugar transport protein 8 n=1 Tax=Sesamum alatum TaxID=300844 RepID=A0AAE1YPZ4_9LAMI|nr:Sugar transport protein 8 [Sesamum alatum]
MPNLQENNVFKSKITNYMLSCWIFAALTGLMFGYDTGIIAGVTGTDDFLSKFFPDSYKKRVDELETNYCRDDDKFVGHFKSSIYLAAAVASFVAAKACSSLGRRPTLMMASVFFVSGSLFGAVAQTYPLLLFGRILYGIGIGFATQAAPLFLTEIAPLEHRGAVNILFQLFVTIGIFVGNLVNYGALIHPSGWRTSVGLAAVPGLVILVGSFIITESPLSLVERGKETEGKGALRKYRGVEEVDAEYEQLVTACEQVRRVKHPYLKLVGRSGIPPLFITIIIQVFQQYTGINAIMFYTSVLLQTMGFQSDMSLLSSLVIGLVNVCSNFMLIYVVDRVGRRKLLLVACVQMFISQVAIGVILTSHLLETGTLDKSLAAAVVVLVCTFVMAFAWSWGPMGWLIPTEIFPIETRTAGYSFAVSSNMLFTYVISQTFLSMMCSFKSLIFFFFSGWILVMGIFTAFLLPETKGVPVDLMGVCVWRQHPVWKRFFEDDGKSCETT